MPSINQPFDSTLEDVIFNYLDNNTDTNKIYICVAYAKLSGVNRIYDRFSHLITSGTEIIMTVGIDQRNTSYEALNSLLNITSNLYIYHNRSLSVTYHPKVYYFENSTNSLMITGSNNLTAGGFYINDEVFSYFENEPSSASFINNIENRYTDTSSDFCMEATASLIEDLLEQNYICREADISISRTSTTSESTEVGEHIFGSSTPTRRINSGDVSSTASDSDTEVHTDSFSSENDDDFESELTLEFDEENVINASSFWKVLSDNDVSTSSSPGQMIIPIGFSNYFNFGPTSLTRSGAEQSEHLYSSQVIFIDSTGTIISQSHIPTTRTVYYIPAPTHARQNSEVRFTFRNNIYQRTSTQDIILFEPHLPTETEPYEYIIYIIAPGSTLYNAIRTSASQRYGEIASTLVYRYI